MWPPQKKIEKSSSPESRNETELLFAFNYNSLSVALCNGSKQ